MEYILTGINSILIMIILWEKVHHILMERLNRPNGMIRLVNKMNGRIRWERNPENAGIPFDEELLKINKLPPLKEWKKTIKKIFINS